MRWICKSCYHQTTGGWCDRCRRNSGIFTSAEMPAPRDPEPVRGMDPSEVERVVANGLRNFGGKDPGVRDE